MEHSSVSARAEDLPLLPLLVAVGAAATAFSVYCYVKGGGGKKTTADPENKTTPEVPVCDQNHWVLQDQLEEDVTEDEERIQDHVVSNNQLEDRVKELEELLRATCRDMNIKVSVAEAKEKHRTSEKIIAQLEEEKSELSKQVKTLRDTVQKCEREQESYSILQTENKELKKSLIHEKLWIKVSVAEAEEKHRKAVESIAQLEEEKSVLTKQVETLRDNVEVIRHLLHKHNMESANLTKACVHEWEELLKVSVAEVEEKHQIGVDTIEQLEKERSDLTKQVETLRDTVKEYEKDQEAHGVLQAENSELKKSLIHEKLLLKVAVAEAEEKHQKSVQTITQLEKEKADLFKQVETPRDTVKACEQEQESYSILQAENNELKKSLIHEKLLLKVSVAEAEEKHQKAVETIAQLKDEKSNLTQEVEILKVTVKECESEREAHRILQAENDETVKTLLHEKELMKVSVDEAEKKHQRSLETISQLEEEKSDLTKQVETLKDNVEDMGHLLHKHNMESANLTKACVQEWEELLKVSVAKAEDKHQKAVETIAQLEEETSGLSKQLETLRDTVKVFEHERQSHSILQTENNELKKSLIHEKLLLKVSVAEAEEKHQKAVDIIAQLKEEKSDLTKQLETLSDIVKGFEREQEAQSVLQAENNKKLKTLIHEKEILEVSVAEAVENHRKAVENISQLEEEKSGLIRQVETLKDNVEGSQHLLHKHNTNLTQVSVTEAEEKYQKAVETIAQLEEETSDLTKQLETLRDTVKECEREREAHSILQAENDEMLKTLIHQKELLKVSVAEADEKHQKAVETITQLEKLKSDLTKQVEALNNAAKASKRDQEAHLIIQAENDRMLKTLIQDKELLKVSVAEAEKKHQKAVESITKLEEEKSDLIKQVETLRDTVKKCTREWEAQCILQTENDEILKTMIHEKEILKVSMVEAEKKHQIAVETIAQLEEEKSDLTKQVETLRDTVKESEKERESHSIVQAENDKMLKTLIHEKELLKVSMAEAEEKHQKAVETITQLEKEKSDLAKQVERLKDIGHLLIERNVKFANLTKMFEREREELMKVSLAKGEEKHQKDVETIAQLEEEKSDLTKQVERLRDIVQDMGTDLFETHRECEELINDQEREAHSVIQFEYDELKKALTHKEELLKVSLAEAEEKHQRAVQTIAQLEEEKSDLTSEVATLRTTLQDMGNNLFETHRECDRLTDEFEREREAYRILQSEYHEMKKTHEDLCKDK